MPSAPTMKKHGQHAATGLSAAERKKRKPLSCDLCRLRRKKCDRKQPCGQCIAAQRDCVYKQATAHLSARNGVHPEKWSQSLPASKHATNLRSISLDETSKVLTLITHDAFIVDFLAFWFDEMDYMYDSVVDTQLHVDFLHRTLNFRATHYQSLLAGLIALAAQLMPSEVDKRLAFHLPNVGSATDWQEACHRFCKATCDDVLDSYGREGVPLQLEYLQSSLQCVAYAKNCGRLSEYRNRIGRDISCLQLARIHLLDHPYWEKTTIYRFSRQRHTARRLFWSYFQYDRFLIMQLNIGITLLNVDQCHIWLCDSDGRLTHIRNLVQDSLPDAERLTDAKQFADRLGRPTVLYSAPQVAPLNPHSTEDVPCMQTIAPLSRFSSAMVKGAAIAGALIATISEVPFSAPNEVENGLIEQTRQVLQYRSDTAALEACLSALQLRYNVSIRDTQLMGTSSRYTRKEQSQNRVLAITLANLRFDTAVELAHALPPYLLDPVWFEEKKTEMAIKLLQYALEASSEIAIDRLSWSFFLFYLSKPMKVLQTTVHGTQSVRQAEEISVLVEKGSTLLGKIAEASRLPLAHQLKCDISPILEAGTASHMFFTPLSNFSDGSDGQTGQHRNDGAKERAWNGGTEMDTTSASVGFTPTLSNAMIPHSSAAVLPGIPSAMEEATLDELIDQHKELFDSLFSFQE